MQKDLERFHEANLQIVGISYDSEEILKRFADGSQIKFPLLSDPEVKVIEAYELLNDKARQKIAHPATLVIDQTGKVREKLQLEGYRKRHSTDVLLEAARRLHNEK